MAKAEGVTMFKLKLELAKDLDVCELQHSAILAHLIRGRDRYEADVKNKVIVDDLVYISELIKVIFQPYEKEYFIGSKGSRQIVIDRVKTGRANNGTRLGTVTVEEIELTPQEIFTGEGYTEKVCGVCKRDYHFYTKFTDEDGITGYLYSGVCGDTCNKKLTDEYPEAPEVDTKNFVEVLRVINCFSTADFKEVFGPDYEHYIGKLQNTHKNSVAKFLMFLDEGNAKNIIEYSYKKINTPKVEPVVSQCIHCAEEYTVKTDTPADHYNNKGLCSVACDKSYHLITSEDFDEYEEPEEKVVGFVDCTPSLDGYKNILAALENGGANQSKEILEQIDQLKKYINQEDAKAKG